MQEPQFFLSTLSGVSFKSVIIDPSKIQDPWEEVRILVFFPNHPSPDFSATARSFIAPSSTKIRPLALFFVISEFRYL